MRKLYFPIGNSTVVEAWIEYVFPDRETRLEAIT